MHYKGIIIYTLIHYIFSYIIVTKVKMLYNICRFLVTSDTVMCFNALYVQKVTVLIIINDII